MKMGGGNKVGLYKGNDIATLEKQYEHSLEHNIQELIVYFGMRLKKEKKRMDELFKWALYENILKAAMELNLCEYIDIYYNKLKEKFSMLNGKKLNMLKGMIYEIKDKKKEALDIYKHYLNKFPCDVTIRARIISLKKSEEKNTNKIIQLLNDNLKEFPVDIESWHELGEIYLSECLYNYSIYCFEEILLHKPTNLYYILTCAEIHYTISQFEMSSKYFCLAIKLQSNNLRGLWGVVMVNVARYSQKGQKISNDNVDIILTRRCLDRLDNLYNKMKINFIYKSTIINYLNELKDIFK
ncbi:ER membrane protein complex subunit 2, putative [Plasmodium chabaudi chabaudi]|uniref:ER membrane protein complex subunit 2 n=1 Tax=Plasmodium chabaudi chabaudi TaxID=31271 RepID=A0A1C6XG12_PLACU|nr:ER membrane protein complex subunit 2, putative [Plasmodium chabaudi chabaudi]SCM05550.1 ER membrane protein complex subunit 2, putative [Plasmodium chabaudi chabaudi]